MPLETEKQDALMARRVPRLEGGRNFRDLGGYRSGDGRRVRWGMLYRSGTMSGLTPADYDALGALSIRSVCDLRTPEERETEPNAWAKHAGVKYWTRDYVSSFGELRKVLASDLPTVAAARTAMLDGYRRLPFEQAPAHKALFAHLLNEEVPLVFHCTAGKDRAGTAAAVLLSALGVRRDAILEDYRLTDKVLDRSRFVSASAARANGTIHRISPEVIAAVLGTHDSYIAAALDIIVERRGSIEAYLHTELGLDRSQLARIRDLLLE